MMYMGFILDLGWDIRTCMHILYCLLMLLRQRMDNLL